MNRKIENFHSYMDLLVERLQRNQKLEKVMMHSLSVQAAFIFLLLIAGSVYHHSDLIYALLLIQLVAFVTTFIIGKSLWKDWL